MQLWFLHTAFVYFRQDKLEISRCAESTNNMFMQEVELTCDNFCLVIFQNQVHFSVFSSKTFFMEFRPSH